MVVVKYCLLGLYGAGSYDVDREGRFAWFVVKVKAILGEYGVCVSDAIELMQCMRSSLSGHCARRRVSSTNATSVA